MLLAASGIEFFPLSPVAWAFGISLACSCAGVSGAFLLLPWQFSVLGHTAPGVSATNQIFNVLACPAGVWGYAREGRMLWPLARLIALGSLPGVLLGALARATIFSGVAQFRAFAACALLYLAWRLLKKGGGGGKVAAKQGSERAECRAEGPLLALAWRGEEWKAPKRGIFLASLLTGLVGGIYGIGGGAMLSPILASYYGLPLHLLAGATLFGTFATSIFGLGSYLLFAWLMAMPELGPDWGLGLLLGLGGIMGMRLGAALQKRLPASLLKRGLGVIILATGLFYLGQSAGQWLG